MEYDINVFWDLDGVVFKYERDAYVGDNPPYAQSGYFRNRQTDDESYIILENMSNNSNVTGLYILSRGAVRLSQEQRKNVIKDKMINVKNSIPWFKESNIIITEISKVEEAMNLLGRKLTRTDVLIDDFNENLRLWKSAGGTAIKYINGLNSVESYSGAKIKNGKLIDVPSDTKELCLKIF